MPVRVALLDPGLRRGDDYKHSRDGSIKREQVRTLCGGRSWSSFAATCYVATCAQDAFSLPPETAMLTALFIIAMTPLAIFVGLMIVISFFAAIFR